MSEPLTFAYVLKPIRPDFVDTMSPEEERIVEVHFEYLKRKLEEGILVFAGRCLDGEFGIVIFRAESQQEAEAFMGNDPAVREGVMTAEFYPFLTALIGSM